MLETVFQQILFGITIFTLLLQFYVVYLIRFKSPKSISEYRYFLVIFMIFDITFNLVFGLLLEPYPVAPNIAACCRGLASFVGFFACQLSMSGVFYSGTCLMLAHYYCLIYISVTHQSAYIHRMFMTPKVKAGFLTFFQVVSIVIGFFTYNCLLKKDELPYQYTKAEFLDPIKPTDNVVWIDNFKSSTLIFLIVLFGSFSIAELLAFILVVVTLVKLRRNSHFYSKRTFRLHLQFTLLVGVQLFTPVIFVFIPFMAAIFCVFLQYPVSNAIAEVGLICLALYGSTNSLFTIYFVGPFREYTYGQLIIPLLRPVYGLFGLKRPDSRVFHLSVQTIQTSIAEHRM